MANSTIPGLVAVSVPALTDLFGVRQSGDSRDKKLTVTQLITLLPGGGDVSKVGTPVDNQLGVWTGDGTLEGESELTYVNAILTFSGVNGKVRGSLVNSGAILNEASSSGNPTLLPNVGDTATGIGGTANNLSIVVRGVAGTRWQHSTAGAGEVRQFQDLTSGLVASTTQTQGNGILNGAAFSEITVVANVDDVVTLHNTGGAEYWTTIINTGANRLQIFPPVGDLILPNALNASITLDVNKAVTLYTLDGTNWIRLVDPASGGGDVFKVGTPANNQLGVWTGDGTIEGDTNWQVVGAALQGVGGSSPEMRNVGGVNIHPRKGDTDTGLSSGGDNRLQMVAQGVVGIKLIGAASAILQVHDTTVGLTAFAGGGAGSATQLNSSYSVVDTVATTGDSVKFSTTLEVGLVNYVKNDGANAMDLFPAGGDDLGLGVGVAISVAAGKSVAFIGTVTGSVSTQFIFQEVAGGGDVTKVGTPANNQLANWTGDGTLEGDANFLLTGTQLILPSGSSAGLPELKIGSGQTGFFASSTTQLRITVNGTERFTITNDIIQGFLAGSGQLHNRVSSATVPTFTPNTNDGDTGIGGPGGDVLSLIAGGVEALRVTEVAGVVQALVPAGIEASPSYSFSNDPDTGFINETNVIVAVTGASRRVAFSSAGITSVTSGNFAIRDEVPSATNPVLTPAGTDADTGIGSAAADQLSLIAGGVEIARLSESTEDQFIVSPGQFLGSAALPALALGDGDTGFYETFDDVLFLAIGGVNRFVWADAANSFQGAIGSSGWVRNEVASATNPTIGPSSSDSDTGIGSAAADQLDLIAGALSCMSVRETGSARQIGFYTTAPISQQTGVAVSIAAVHAALVALGLITA